MLDEICLVIAAIVRVPCKHGLWLIACVDDRPLRNILQGAFCGNHKFY